MGVGRIPCLPVGRTGDGLRPRLSPLTPRPTGVKLRGMNHRLRLRRHLQELERARDALADAKEHQADPWRVAELQLRYDRLNEQAMAEEFDWALPPAGRRVATPVPLGPGGRRG